MNYYAAEIYPVSQMYLSVGEKMPYEHVFRMLRESGYNGWEGVLDLPEETASYMPLLKKSGLEMRSAYMNVVLHDQSRAEDEIKRVLNRAEEYAPQGLECLLVNPMPLDWINPVAKNEEQLDIQLENINTLGHELRKRGVTLSYHSHDMEMLNGAKEMLHMLSASDEQAVSWCFDPEWIAKGSGNGGMAPLDWARIFGHRVTVIHYRQAVKGISCQVTCDGDIDYRGIQTILESKGASPLLVNEQLPGNLKEAFPVRDKLYTDSLTYIKSIFG
ncbi:MAG: hypothetical protein PQJ58_05930 [Spirochaetales bacterium]|nr:hypothetical protein [Spirochaetales bacterium]